MPASDTCLHGLSDASQFPRRTLVAGAIGLATFLMSGCIDIALPGSGKFVAKGVADSIEDNGACLLWRANDGRVFDLHQNAAVSNSNFDAVTTPGTAGRLQLSPRSDLGLPCAENAIVAEVTQVLEINGTDVVVGL